MTILVILATTACDKRAPVAAPPRVPPSTSGELRVPIDHATPAAGTFPLHYELGAPFDSTKPTIMLVVDGQQPLAARYAHARVVVLDDDHVFSSLAKSGLARDLVAAFAREGLHGAALGTVLAKLAVVRAQ